MLRGFGLGQAQERADQRDGKEETGFQLYAQERTQTGDLGQCLRARLSAQDELVPAVQSLGRHVHGTALILAGDAVTVAFAADFQMQILAVENFPGVGLGVGASRSLPRICAANSFIAFVFLILASESIPCKEGNFDGLLGFVNS